MRRVDSDKLDHLEKGVVELILDHLPTDIPWHEAQKNQRFSKAARAKNIAELALCGHPAALDSVHWEAVKTISGKGICTALKSTFCAPIRP